MADRRVRRLFLRVLLGVVALVLVLAGLIALDDTRLPRRSRAVDRLDAPEKERIAAALHLWRAFGDSIWPGWSQEESPVVLYNEGYAFLVGLDDPPPGWIKVPGRKVRGGPWQLVPEDSFGGAPYYRQPLTADRTPEAFTVRIGEHWAASLPTYDWFAIDLAAHIRRSLPAALAAVFPYRLAQRLLLGGETGYLSIVEHEAFHAHQGRVAPEHVVAAERATTLEARYPGTAAFERDWQRETDLLARAAAAPTRGACVTLASRFLAQRRLRRMRARLDSSLVGYERQREWLEGLARYVEVESWRRVARMPDDQPPGDAVPARRRAARFDAKWRQELMQMRTTRGDARFYETGLAQAVVLDRIAPGWKAGALAADASLEDLLAAALAENGSR